MFEQLSPIDKWAPGGLVYVESGQGHISVSSITNIIAQPGLSVTAGLGTLLGSVTNAYVENQSPDLIANHSIKQLTDALAVASLLASLDSGLTLNQFAPLLEGGSNRPKESLEAIINSIGDLLGVGIEVELDNRDQLYGRIAAIRTALYVDAGLAAPVLKPAYQGLHVSAVGTSGADLAASAQADTPEGLAHRYSLAQLNPFVITGADAAATTALYAPHNASGELDLYDPDTGEGVLSEGYLEDRGRMLALGTRLNVADTGFEPNSVEGDTSFIDLDRTLRLDAGLTGVLGTPRALVKFGAAASEFAGALDGASHHDRLYGGGGNDVIHGFAGDDRVLGGAGADLLFGRLMQNPSITARLTPPQHGETMPTAPA